MLGGSVNLIWLHPEPKVHKVNTISKYKNMLGDKAFFLLQL